MPEVVRLKRCPHCQNNVARDLMNCPKCGAAFTWAASRQQPPANTLPVRPPVAPAAHDVTIALSASLLLIGSGQIYNHQSGKGLMMIALFVAGMIFLIASRFASGLIIALLVMLWVVSILDAALIAGRILNQERVRPWQWF